MRMFILLTVVVAATSMSFFSSADSARGLSFTASQARQEAVNSRCAKRVAIGSETACLMQKRRGRA
ncbi:hypothetical protein [Methylocystis parvus]|uniref:hypothetical protein n=1 Tax=Methylocystis parvus TaxID=134 RepID=UPI003C72592C